MSIFVSIVSYRDTEILPTIESLMSTAKNPEDLVLGVVSQDEKRKHPDLSFIKNKSYIKMDFREARGVGYARKLAMELYNGEDFFLQIDSHMRFAKNWDSKLKDMYRWCSVKEGTEKIVLSQFPAPYEIHTNGKEFYPKDHEELWDRPSWSKVHNRDFGAWSAERQEMNDPSCPQPTHTLLAGYIFTTGKFVKDLPYDERISFMGEELCLAIRAYTRGWEFYAPNEMLVWHYYKRKRSPKIWDQIDDMKRDHKWMQLEMNSKRIQKDILTGKEKGIYGIQNEERYRQYQEMIGIDFSEFYDTVMHEKINNAVQTQEIIF
jgi:hypothetical protein